MITKPLLKIDNENIIDYIEVSKDELKNMVKKGLIDDAFTLSALSLYYNL